MSKTPSRNEPATFRLVAQRLNKRRNRVPQLRCKLCEVWSAAPNVSLLILLPHGVNVYGKDVIICKGLSKKMDGIWNRYNLKSTGRIYMFGILKCSEKFKVLDLP